MQPLCLSRGEEDESRVNGDQQLSPVAKRTDSHIQGFSWASCVFVFQRRVEAQFASSRLPCALLLPLLPPFYGLASIWFW